MGTRRYGRLLAGVMVVPLALAACSGGGDDASDGGGGATGGGTLTLWHYETADGAMGIAWDEAIRVFEQETGATVEFEQKSFEQIQQTAGMVLSSDEGPDIMEYNKGNATAGLLSSQGLLTDLTDVAKERGWDRAAPGEHPDDRPVRRAGRHGLRQAGTASRTTASSSRSTTTRISSPSTASRCRPRSRSWSRRWTPSSRPG